VETEQFSNVLSNYVSEVTSSDIQDFGNNIVKDYLSEPMLGYDAIITNPPFMLAEQFIEKACSETRLVAMLLKSQFWHAKKRMPLFLKYRPSFILPLLWRPDFMYQDRKNGEKGSPTMDMIWTVWIEGMPTSTYYPLEKPSL